MGNKEIKRAIPTISIHAGMYDNSHNLPGQVQKIPAVHITASGASPNLTATEQIHLLQRLPQSTALRSSLIT